MTEWPEYVANKTIKALPIVRIEEATLSPAQPRKLFVDPLGNGDLYQFEEFIPRDVPSRQQAHIGDMAVQLTGEVIAKKAFMFDYSGRDRLQVEHPYEDDPAEQKANDPQRPPIAITETESERAEREAKEADEGSEARKADDPHPAKSDPDPEPQF
jgi:hypothetical protein